MEVQRQAFLNPALDGRERSVPRVKSFILENILWYLRRLNEVQTHSGQCVEENICCSCLASNPDSSVKQTVHLSLCRLCYFATNTAKWLKL